MRPHRLPLSAAAAQIADGRLTSEALVKDCLARIDERDGAVHAWALVDREGALERARELDKEDPIGPLHGIPVGVKDVIDTAGMVTAYGSPAFATRVPDQDATCIAKLKAAGAIILGKVATTEFATYHPGPTANPLNLGHTPGGSSSGSAAAVADFQIGFAFGTQTAGSIIRPASFCGVLGFKPSFDRYATSGMLDTAPSLDTLGGFARTVSDLALIDQALGPRYAPTEADRLPVIGVCRTSAWPEASDEVKALLQSTADRLKAAGYSVMPYELPEPFDRLAAAQTLIHCHEASQVLGWVRDQHDDQISDTFRAFIDQGRAVEIDDYHEALAVQRSCQAGLDDLFNGVELLLTPSALGTAPAGLQATGNPAFCRLWTALGTPCLGFPVAAAANGLPLGLQLIANNDHDRALLAWADPIIAAASQWTSPL